MVSAYFMLTGAYAAFIAVGIAGSLLRGSPGFSTLPSNHWVALGCVTSLAYGCLRTSRLLDRRRREGVIAAGLFILAPLVGFIAGSPPSPVEIGIATLGLVLLVGVWRHLR